jgi:hypothetical protein
LGGVGPKGTVTKGETRRVLGNEQGEGAWFEKGVWNETRRLEG